MGLFLSFCSAPLVHVPAFVRGPLCLITGALQCCLKSGRILHPALFFFLRTALAILDLLWFHVDFTIICFSSAMYM